MDYNTRKMKILVFPALASFELENENICPSGPTYTISSRMPTKYFSKKSIGITYHPKFGSQVKEGRLKEKE